MMNVNVHACTDQVMCTCAYYFGIHNFTFPDNCCFKWNHNILWPTN